MTPQHDPLEQLTTIRERWTRLRCEDCGARAYRGVTYWPEPGCQVVSCQRCWDGTPARRDLLRMALAQRGRVDQVDVVIGPAGRAFHTFKACVCIVLRLHGRLLWDHSFDHVTVAATEPVSVGTEWSWCELVVPRGLRRWRYEFGEAS